MSSSSPPKPPQIKAFLASLKERFLDDQGGGDAAAADVLLEEDASVTVVAELYAALLRLELLQRGVLVAAAAGADGGVLWTALQTHAGKTLHQQGDSAGPAMMMPKPLAAGSSVVAGRLAEKLASVLQRQQTTNKDDVLLVSGEEQQKACQAALSRCREVKDERLRLLLQLAVDSRKGDDCSWMLIIDSLYLVAEGYFLRATSFQPDAPPMWKKAWDCVTARRANSSKTLAAAAAETETEPPNQHHNPAVSWEAITSVTNLIRIATSKDNAKRAAELSLTLADCYLDAAQNDKDGGEETCTKQLKQTFLEEYRPIAKSDCVPSPEQAIQKAADCLQKAAISGSADNDTRDSDDNYRRLLQLRVSRAQQDAEIAAEALADHEKAKNRAPSTTLKGKTGSSSSTTVKLPSLAWCQSQARQRRLADADNAVSAALQDSAVAVRDQIVLPTITNNKQLSELSSSPYYPSACRLMAQHVQYLQERARAMAVVRTKNQQQQQGWSTLATFVEPVLQLWTQRYKSKEILKAELSAEGGGSSTISPQELHLMEMVCSIVPCVEWMCCGVRSSGLVFPVNLLVKTQEFAALFEDRRRAAAAKKKAESKSVGGTQSPSDTVLLTLELAQASLTALLALDRNDGGSSDTALVRKVTDTATSRSTSSSTDALDSEMGCSYLEFLVCWSGFHRTPWPFCTQPEARALVARARSRLHEAHSRWGKPVSPAEELILKLGEADAEGSSFDGGLVGEALKNYKQVMSEAGTLSDRLLADVFMARCYSGVAQLVMRDPQSIEAFKDLGDSAGAIAQGTLEKLVSISLSADSDGALYLWRSKQFVISAVRFQVAASRQLVADTLLRSGNAVAAQSFLEDAVRDCPNDAGAAFALGSFRLHLAFFGNDRSLEIDKAAQVQLLQAAKLDSTRAGPFALLGYWYEYKTDSKRAVGCYSKALLLDPSNPVAGRGVIRLAPAKSLKKVFDKAIESGSAVVGWAWRAVARQKAMVDGDDTLAVVALLNALRCRDLERPDFEPLSEFYSSPLKPALPGKMELSGCLADLAACYYRLGRYTASLRSYHAAIEKAADKVPGSLLCSCAQVEMELGLYEDAEERLKVIDIGDTGDAVLVAAYGQGVALAAIAQRDNQDGKSGSAKRRIQQAVDVCQKIREHPHVCVQKLIGDLHTFGASLPPDVFTDEENASSFEADESVLRSQLSFISKGEHAYRAAVDLVVGDTEDSDVLRASLYTDAGANLLMQAQLLSAWEEKGLKNQSSPEAKKSFESAAQEFRRAVEVCPTFAPAWCGLGCAMARSDPLLAQHAFSRSLQLDNLYPDPYANLSFLFTDYRKFAASASVSDALTEVADTPMMWINRGFMFEIEAAANPGEARLRECILQAADAYRAALQVVKHPSAMVGLAMTCRAFDQSSSMMHESQSYTTEYLGVMGRSDVPTFTLNGILSIENGLREFSSQSEQLINDGQQQVRQGINRLGSEEITDDQSMLLNSKLLQEVSVASPVATSENSCDSETTTWRLERRVLHEPNRGDLWIQLSKDLAAKRALAPAEQAARKGSSIMMQQLSGFLALPSAIRVVRSEDLSDALSLQYWLETMDDNDESKEEADGRGVINLQRSLLISPGNSIAREALKSISHP